MKEAEKIKFYLCKYLMSFLIVFSLFLMVLSIKSLRIKVICTSLSLLLGIVFGYSYYSKANSYYGNKRHNIEMNYFNYIDKTNIKILKELDASKISKMIFNLSGARVYKEKYLVEGTSMFLSTLILIMILCIMNNIILLPVYLVLVGLSFYIRYRYLDKIELNYEENNKYLNEFIEKIVTIKKLNIYEFAKNKLNSDVRNSDYLVDYSHFMSILNIIVFIIKFIFILVLLVKKTSLISLLIMIVLSIFNEIGIYYIGLYIRNKKENIYLSNELKNILGEKRNYKRIGLWQTFKVENGLFYYEKDETNIKIPEFEIERLDQISIMGKQSEGKSSILNIISGLYELNSGSILIDNKRSDKLVNSVYLSDDISIFNMSLRDNLCLGNEIQDKKLREYVKELDFSEWVDELDNGFDTIIDNSIDEIIKEKINLIRAIVLDSDVYLLDDPTEGMDLDSEKCVANVIKKYFKDKTFIIVTGRPVLTTICNKHYFIKEHTLMEKETLL